jgi:hypothetical protein
MSSKLYIAIPCYNRRAVVEQCVPTVAAGASDDDAVILYDDGSTEYDRDFWAFMEAHTTGSVQCESMGIDAQRRRHFLEFWGNREIHGCTHLYLTDSDCIHDIGWRSALLALQEKYDGAPLCGYRTKTHADYENNIYADIPEEDVIWQRFAPGTSYLLTMAHVEKIVKHMPEKWSWDWSVPGFLGYRMAVSRVSYVDHIDIGGLHSPGSGLGPERGTNPTPWLAEKRAQILASLNLQDAP